MKATELELRGLYLLEPEVFEDERGFFFESFNQTKFEQAIGRKVTFVQDNHSKSSKGVLRGLHYQDPQPQGKLIRVIQGEIYDVAVDIRPDSLTFGKWVANYLSAENKNQHWIPEGFAHGFLVVSDFAEVLYKTTDYYAPDCEKCIAWDDPALNIPWPLSGLPTVSVKDQQGLQFNTLK
jgi:dTDP-4-dehydrorhamnose 3,5-epimerase